MPRLTATIPVSACTVSTLDLLPTGPSSFQDAYLTSKFGVRKLIRYTLAYGQRPYRRVSGSSVTVTHTESSPQDSPGTASEQQSMTQSASRRSLISPA